MDHDAIDDREDCRSGADAEREREDDHAREYWLVCERAHGVAHVGEPGVGVLGDGAAPGHAAVDSLDLRFDARIVAEQPARFRLGGLA